MKTPEEIKKALECCFYDSEQCGECPYYPVSCDRELVRDARDYIQQLEGTVSEMEKVIEELKPYIRNLEYGIAEWEHTIESPVAVDELVRDNTELSGKVGRLEKEKAELFEKFEQLQAELDAAVSELVGTCQVCRWEDTAKCASCHFCEDVWDTSESNWQWRGVQKED